jgi:hypothetical protein
MFLILSLLHDEDALGRCGWNVNIVNPNPSPPNDPELRRCLEQFSRDLRLGPDNETIVVLFDMKIL